MIQKDVDKELVSCHHCGDHCYHTDFAMDKHVFCCLGCQSAYTWISKEGLGYYYTNEDSTGNRPVQISGDKYSFLEDPDIVNRLIKHHVDEHVRIEFNIPGIHCSSCIYLLEHLHKLHPGIKSSRVNFLQKKASVHYEAQQISLREVVEILHYIGYPPNLSFAEFEAEQRKDQNKTLLYKIGVAGFCFGNIMLLSFPDYLGLQIGEGFRFIAYINIVLSIPVLFYSGVDYLKKAYKQLNSGFLGIDIPIALGMLALFFKSLSEIVMGTGEGYLDSLSGFIFFLLIGNWFKEQTYRSLSFDRSYTSYFPMGTWIWKDEDWKTMSIDKIKKGDKLLIKNGDLIPCDGILKSGKGSVDYQYVTGESKWVSVDPGQKLFAGGKQVGGAIELLAIQTVDQSYLTQLWNEAVFKDKSTHSISIVLDYIGRYFTLGIIGLSLIGFSYWYFFANDMQKAIEVFATVLIVACPCVLALSVPFIYGSILRILKNYHWFVQNTETIEAMQDIDMVVFDKTGTLTDSESWDITYEGVELNPEEKIWIRSAVLSSIHPLSRGIFHFFSGLPVSTPEQFKEHPGLGIHARLNDHVVKLGSGQFIFGVENKSDLQSVFVEIDGKFKGRFSFINQWREGLNKILDELSGQFELAVISGDDSREEQARLAAFVPVSCTIKFNQKPKDKLDFIAKHQALGKRILMVGDGLNDAGALKQSDVGIVVSNSGQNFMPACNLIMERDSFRYLSSLLSTIKKSKSIIYGAFVLAGLYNVIGLYFAMQGLLTPIVAAILMPISSVTIIAYSFLMTGIFFRKINLNETNTNY